MILVCGSANMDLVAQSPHLPCPGETVLGSSFSTHPGGKGANQAVAIARLGGSVKFIGKLGEDAFGQALIDSMEAFGVDTSPCWRSLEPTGIALIVVDGGGQNQIVVVPGANGDLHPADVRRAVAELSEAPLVALAQLEIPIKSALAFALECQARDVPWRILNPAPALPLSAALLRSINVITPNESETEAITGIRLSESGALAPAAAWFHEQGVQYVAITLGSRGVFVSSPNGMSEIPARSVEAIDTTAAGDCFAGALAYGLAEGGEFTEACEFACRAATLSVTRAGAQESMPTRKELDGWR